MPMGRPKATFSAYKRLQEVSGKTLYDLNRKLSVSSTRGYKLSKDFSHIECTLVARMIRYAIDLGLDLEQVHDLFAE
jgi:hypothetical protein